MEMGFEKVLVVLTRPAGYRKKKNGGPFANIVYHKHKEFANAFNTRYITYNNQLDLVDKCVKDGVAIVLQPSEYIKTGRIEKDKKVLQKLYNLGHKNAMESKKKITDFLGEISR